MPEIDRTPDISSIAPLTLPGDRQLVMRVMPMPADANGNGDIFGGWIMAQVDVAGAVLPARIAKGRIATVAVNQFVFKQPVSISDLLSFYAKVERVGRTSVTVNVEVYAERNPADLHVVKVTEANLTYVAIDIQGKPRPIPRAGGRCRFRTRKRPAAAWPPGSAPTQAAIRSSTRAARRRAGRRGDRPARSRRPRREKRLPSASAARRRRATTMRRRSTVRPRRPYLPSTIGLLSLSFRPPITRR